MSFLFRLNKAEKAKKKVSPSGVSAGKITGGEPADSAEKAEHRSDLGAQKALAGIDAAKADLVLDLLETAGVPAKKALKIVSECEAKGFGDSLVSRFGRADLKWLTPILIKAGLPLPALLANARNLVDCGFDRKKLSGLTVSQVGMIIASSIGTSLDSPSGQGCSFLYDVIDNHNGIRAVRIKGFASFPKGALLDLQIPETIDGLPVCIVGKSAFKGCDFIQSVQLPDSVDLLGASCFEGCQNLESAELSPILETVQKRTFANCESLLQVVLPYSLKRIASEAFLGCKSLEFLPHYVRRGIGATMTLDRGLLEEKLPSGLEYIGNAAFKGCESLESAFIPYQVSEIRKSAFEGCAKLSDVGLHLRLEKISDRAFAGCSSLESLRLPDSLAEIGADAFDPSTELVYEEGAPAANCDSFDSRKVRYTRVPREGLSSQLVPGSDKPFYDDEDLRDALESFELRSVAPLRREPRKLIDQTCESRFDLVDGVFKAKNEGEDGRVVIRMTGDLMCCPTQQKYACDKNGDYDFTFSFSSVADLLQGSDITIGNMESMCARSFVLSDERRYVDDRVHLNAPEEYIHAVAKAGYDVVVNAQNHAYDVGLHGIFETLDALNRQGLIHTGLFAGEDDRRFVLLEANGIRIGLVSYFDQARQPMKRANYTEKGLSTVFSTFDEDRIKADIAAARKEGAEFVIAYCHWGREYTTEITNRQESFAVTVANAGADFLLGSHSHNLQPYSCIETDDGRKVPVLYSAGNFVSDMSIYMPGNIDTAVIELVLSRNSETSAVEIERQGYYPCVIQRRKDWRGFVRTVPLGKLRNSFKKQEFKDGVDERAMRIAKIIGDGLEFPCLDEVIAENALSLCVFPSYKEELAPLPKVKIASPDCAFEEKYAREGDGVYTLKNPTTPNSATLAISGYLDYSSVFEKSLTYGSSNMFPAVFANVESVVKDSDLAIGAITAPCCADYLTSGAFPKNIKAYKNADARYYDAIAGCGFDCLALASATLDDCGSEGFMQSVEAIEDRGMVASGAAGCIPIFKINGINVAVISYAEPGVSESGLRRYSPEAVSSDITAARARGAEFVLVYSDAQSMRKAARVKHAQEIVDSGADYVVCGTPRFVSEYMRLTNSDGASIPVVSSTGMLASSDGYKGDFALSSIFKVELTKKGDGSIAVNDYAVPAWRVPSGGVVPHQVCIASEYYSSGMVKADEPLARMSEVAGDLISLDRRESRVVKDRVGSFLSPKDVLEIIGVEPSDELLCQLGSAFNEKANGIIGFEGGLRKGCIAFELGSITYEKAAKAGAILFIGRNSRRGALPVVAVSNVVPGYLRCMEAVRSMIDPYVVAITGTMGKTTTKEFMHRVFEERFRTLCIEGNNNTIYSSGCVMQKVEPYHEAYVQEVHGGTKGHAGMASSFLRPNIAVITGIGPGHLEQLGSIENIVKEKMHIIDGLRDNGLLILNNDSPELAELDPSCRTVRCSRSDCTCDYYAKDIVADSRGVSFTICSPEGEFFAAIRTPGEVNVNNALVVFAAAREAGISVDEIVRGLARYRPKSLRANIIQAYGYKLMIDCYNSNPKALREASKALCSLPVEDGGRRIAVLGHMGELAEDASDLHYETGKAIAKEGFDLIITCGSLARRIAEGAHDVGVEVICAPDQESANRIIAREIKPGDTVLFKASHALDFSNRIVVPLFGGII